MAAPTKEGLDYFSFNVDLLDNDSLDFLREKFGVVVNDVYIALLTLLYRKKGYYIPYETETEKQECVWYIYKRIRGGKHPIQQGLIPIVIEALVAQGLFDSLRFNQNDHCNKIITSERAQKTYYKATVERKFESFNIQQEYWMLDDETMRKLSRTHPYYMFLHPENKSDEKLNKSDEYQSKSDEKALKKSKVNITYNEVNKCMYIDSETHTAIQNLYNLICTNLAKCTKLTAARVKLIKDCTYSTDQLKTIFERANSSNFLSGKNKYGFKAGFEWVMNQDNIIKVLEGHYDNGKCDVDINSQLISDKHSYSQEELDNLFNKDNDSNFDF